MVSRGEIGEDSFYVVGVYEDFQIDVFPTHVSPIIAELNGAQYRRWVYKIERPYRIAISHPVGAYFDSLESMFPYMTYQLNEPIKISDKCQVIAISDRKLLVNKDKMKLVFSILAILFKRELSFKSIFRSVQTIKNIFC
jgi:hypothetical protein